jgi:hypothetical protein
MSGTNARHAASPQRAPEVGIHGTRYRHPRRARSPGRNSDDDQTATSVSSFAFSQRGGHAAASRHLCSARDPKSMVSSAVRVESQNPNMPPRMIIGEFPVVPPCRYHSRFAPNDERADPRKTPPSTSLRRARFQITPPAIATATNCTTAAASQNTQQSLAGSSPNLDSHMSRPRRVPFALWKSRALYPRPEALGAVKDCRMGQHLPLEVVVGELSPI